MYIVHIPQVNSCIPQLNAHIPQVNAGAGATDNSSDNTLAALRFVRSGATTAKTGKGSATRRSI